MRVLVLLCLTLLQISVAVSPMLAATRPLCPPATPTTLASGAVAPPSTPASIVFNEILDNPGTQTRWNCATQTSSPWLELFNPHDQTYDLHASFAAIDHGQGTMRFYLPSNSMIAAHGFFVLFPALSNLFVFQGQSAVFRLLLQGIPVDQVTVPALGSDQSYARMPDGSAAWQITDTPTIGVSNSTAIATAVATQPTAPPAHARTSPAPTPSSKRQNTHSTASITPTEPPVVNAPAPNTGKQPAWNSLHLPRSTPTMQAPTSTIVPAAIAAAPASRISVWPLFIGLAGLSAALCGALFWYRKRTKAT